MRRMRSSDRSFEWALLRGVWGVVCSGVLAIVALPIYAQHGPAVAHSPSGAHLAARPSPIGSLAARASASPYFTYIPQTRPSQTAFVADRTLRRGVASAQRRFGFLATRGWRIAGFWPWWILGGTWWPECNAYFWNCDQQGEPANDNFESSEEAPRPMIVVYLHDGSGWGALDYWMAGGMLHIETTYGTEKSFLLDQVDMQRTVNENSAQGINFTIYSFPSPSDNGAMFIPEAYAPACPAGPANSPPAAAGGASEPAEVSWFGADGRATDEGLSVKSVRSDSPAAIIGLRSSDVIVRINCQPIHSTRDIELAVAHRSGTIWVSYLIQGTWLTDKQIRVR